MWKQKGRVGVCLRSLREHPKKSLCTIIVIWCCSLSIVFARVTTIRPFAGLVADPSEMVTVKKSGFKPHPLLSAGPRRNRTTVHSDRGMWFVTYGNTPRYDAARARIIKQALHTGWFDYIEPYTQQNLSIEFQKEFADILSMKKGGGYWIWRFDVLRDVMSKMHEGDVLVFADAGCQINQNGSAKFHEYVELLVQSPYQMLGYQMTYKEHQYTTEAIFSAFSVPSEYDEIRKTGQIAATSQMIQKGRRSEEWLSYIFEVLRKDPNIITDRYNNESRELRDDFRDNRHDQSLQSVSRKIKGFVSVPRPKAVPEDPIWWSRMRGQ